MTKSELTQKLSANLTKKDIQSLLQNVEQHSSRKNPVKNDKSDRKPRTLREDTRSHEIRTRLQEGAAPYALAKELGIRPQFVYRVRSRMSA